LIGELSTSTDDASELVKGLLQAPINAGLQAEMDEHLGYGHSDRKARAQVARTGEQSPQRGVYQDRQFWVWHNLQLDEDHESSSS